ncbi:unnamed protein product, partial [Sphacelaria rigidula]
AKYQDRLFEFRGRKKAIVKPPPVVGGERGEEDFMTQGVMSSGIISPRHGMMEYIGFVSIMLSRGKDLALGGF